MVGITEALRNGEIVPFPRDKFHMFVTLPHYTLFYKITAGCLFVFMVCSQSVSGVQTGLVLLTFFTTSK